MLIPCTVIIPTYNGAHRLPLVLSCLAQQTLLPKEVIVAVDGSTDGTMDLLAASRLHLPQLKVVYQNNSGRAAIRNLGARHASEDLLVFWDDDMEPDPNCLAVHYQHHHAIAVSILTGAQVDKDQPGATDIQRYKVWLTRKWTEELLANQRVGLPLKDAYITAANFSISRALFKKLGGFDARLSDNEDRDLAVRAQAAGIALYYKHEAFAWHNDSVSGVSYVRRQRQYHAAHLRWANLATRELGTQRTHWKRLLFSFFAKSFWISFLDDGKWKYLLPQKMRYRLYDIVITANSVYFPDKVRL